MGKIISFYSKDSVDPLHGLLIQRERCISNKKKLISSKSVQTDELILARIDLYIFQCDRDLNLIQDQLNSLGELRYD